MISLKSTKHKIYLSLSLLKNLISLSYLLLKKNQLINIVQIEHIGDIIASEPILAYLRNKNPRAFIIWFTKNNYVDLLKYNPNLNKIIIVTCITEWIYLKKIFKFKKQYELHLNERFCNICKRSLYKTTQPITHISSENYLNFGSLLKINCIINNLPELDMTPTLYLPNTSNYLDKQYNLNGNYIVIHCKSNEEIKDWNDNKWELIINYIIEKYKLPVIEIGNISTLNIDNTLYKNLCGKLKLLETATLLKNSLLFIGIDSGPAHMANAVKAKGIILLGEYYHGMNNYNPFSGNYRNSINSKIIYSKSKVENISVSEVIDAVDKII